MGKLSGTGWDLNENFSRCVDPYALIRDADAMRVWVHQTSEMHPEAVPMIELEADIRMLLAGFCHARPYDSDRMIGNAVVTSMANALGAYLALDPGIDVEGAIDAVNARVRTIYLEDKAARDAG